MNHQTRHGQSPSPGLVCATGKSYSCWKMSESSKAKEVDPIHTSVRVQGERSGPHSHFCMHTCIKFMRLQSCSEESNFIHVHVCDYPMNALLMSIACSYVSCGQSHVSAYICLQDVACYSHVRWLQGLFCGLFECLSLLPMHIQAQELPEQRRHQ